MTAGGSSGRTEVEPFEAEFAFDLPKE